MKVALALSLAMATLGAPVEVRVLRPPLGLDLHMPVPLDNPLTREKVALGRRLFFDKRLSRDESISCATCHDSKRAFSGAPPLPRGVGGAEGTRHVPALVNRGYGRSFFWDGRAATLEAQVLQPVMDPNEMGLTTSELERRIGRTAQDVAAALASYVRTIRAGDSRFDRYANGRTAALDAREKNGLALFRGKGGCVSCHPAPNFTDEDFHNTGVAWRGGRIVDEGRYVVSGNPRHRGAFKTPTLREVARTPPYMHDGSIATLTDVVEFYADGGRPNSNLDPLIGPRALTINEKRDLVMFLASLTGTVSEGW